MKRSHLAVWYYGPLIIWMVLIFTMSTGIGKDPNTKDLIVRLLGRFAPDLLPTFTPEQLWFLNYGLRKAGHLTEYFVLMGLSVRAFQFGRPELKWYSPVASLALCAVYAASDELHQRFVSGRSGNVGDVIIDVTGAALCLVLILGWFAVKRVERWIYARADAENAEIPERSPLLAERVRG